MKAPRPLDPLAAFPDAGRAPTDDDLKTELRAAYAPVATIINDLHTACPAASAGWLYSPQSGWYRVAMLRQRRLFYLIPKREDFRLSIILGAKGLTALADGPHARQVERFLKNAPRYPEGTVFNFDRTSCDPPVVAALLAAKRAF